MFVRLAAIVALSVTALVGCGSDTPPDPAERFDSLEQSDKDALCEGLAVFGPAWVEDLFTAASQEESSDYSIDDIPEIVEIIESRCKAQNS